MMNPLKDTVLLAFMKFKMNNLLLIHKTVYTVKLVILKNHHKILLGLLQREEGDPNMEICDKIRL